MAARPESYYQTLQNWCTANGIEQPKYQDYSDPRGIRTAWCSGVFVNGREFRATLWRDYRFLEQSREEAAQIAYQTLTGTASSSGQQYSYSHGHGTSR